MYKIKKSIYLLLASFILPSPSQQLQALDPFVQEKINEFTHIEDLTSTSMLINYYIFDSVVFSVFIDYNQQNIPWNNQNFWQNPTNTNRFINDLKRKAKGLIKDLFGSEDLTFSIHSGDYMMVMKLVKSETVNWNTIPHTQGGRPWGEKIALLNLRSEQLPKDINHPYLYDCITKKSVSYLKEKTPSSIHNTKALLKLLFDRGINPYAPVHYYDSGAKKQVTQTPIQFIASPNFEKLGKENFTQHILAHDPQTAINMSYEEKVYQALSRYKVELITFLLDYHPPTLSKEQVANTNIVIANRKYNLGYPQGIDELIGRYTGLFGSCYYDVNSIDTYGHTALDYHPAEDDPVHQVLLKYNAKHHNPIKPIPLPWYTRTTHTLSTMTPDFIKKNPITIGCLGFFFYRCFSK